MEKGFLAILSYILLLNLNFAHLFPEFHILIIFFQAL